VETYKRSQVLAIVREIHGKIVLIHWAKEGGTDRGTRPPYAFRTSVNPRYCSLGRTSQAGGRADNYEEKKTDVERKGGSVKRNGANMKRKNRDRS